MTKQEFLQAFLDTSDEQKVQFAVDAGKMLYQAFGQDYEAFIGFMRATACLFSAADGVVHPTEVGIYNIATGDKLTQEQFFQMTNSFLSQGNNIVQQYYEYVNKFDPELRTILAYFCLALVGYDDTFTAEETMFLLPLLPELD